MIPCLGYLICLQEQKQIGLIKKALARQGSFPIYQGLYPKPIY